MAKGRKIPCQIGRRFGTRVVLGVAVVDRTYQHWLMRCDCGNEQAVAATMIVRGRASTCRRCQGGKRGPESANWKGSGIVPSTAVANFRASAEKRGIEWGLSIEDIRELYELQGGLCALSGERLVFRLGSKRYAKLGNASLDRKDSSKGYVRGNVWLVTSSINFAKQSLSPAEFIAMCIAVVKHSTRKKRRPIGNQAGDARALFDAPRRVA